MTSTINSDNGRLDKKQILTALRRIQKGHFKTNLPEDLTGVDGAIAQVVGEIMEMGSSINKEIRIAARTVGRDGNTNYQIKNQGLSGTWSDNVDTLNQLINDLVQPINKVAYVIGSVAEGNLSKKVDLEMEGRPLKGQFLSMAGTVNRMVDQLQSFSDEVIRVSREVGTEGKLGGQATVKGVSGTWKDLTDNVNQMASNLTDQVRSIAEVAYAMSLGKRTRKITIEAQGEMQDLKNTINTMVDQLANFATEVARVAHEVGTEGKLGGQARVQGVSGTWKYLTNNVNQMAANITDQVRGIINVINAVASGNLRKKLNMTSRGEIAGLVETMNEMIDTLAVFADQVSSVAREVGVEGRLGAQARVPGAQGVWADLTDNVNELANNLTTQVRAIADVSTAVTKGDLSRSISVEARGEVATLKDNINEMISTLGQTTRVNQEQDWLKTNLTNFTRMLQGEKDLKAASEKVLSELASVVNMQHGVFYLMDNTEEPKLRLFSSYGYKDRKHISDCYGLREGLVGQAAYEGQRILLSEAPEDYIKINSGLGEATPLNIVLLPVLYENDPLAVIELASFSRFSEIQISFLDQLADSIAINMNNIQATQRTEELLRQSQSQTEELQSAQEELRQTNEELGDKARLLEEQKREVERKNNDVEKARIDLLDKAEQLELSSKYKSEFLANMSHELRTPLNSLLILSQLLAENKGHNLTEKQVEFAETIYTAGSELLGLISEILDLSKIESGTMSLDMETVSLIKTKDNMARNFEPLAKERGLEYILTLDNTLPESIVTDPKRVEQILKNLLSNAFKFTEKGRVGLSITSSDRGWNFDQPALNQADCVVTFTVSDLSLIHI